MVEYKEKDDGKKILFYGKTPSNILKKLDAVNYSYGFISFKGENQKIDATLEHVCDNIKHSTLVVLLWSRLTKVETCEVGILAKLARQFYVPVWLIIEKETERPAILEHLVNEVGTKGELVDCIVEYYQKKEKEKKINWNKMRKELRHCKRRGR